MQRILIDKNNLPAFAGMLSHTAAERIASGQEVGIGAVANTEDGSSIPAGVLSFYIDKPFVRVTWVYVVPQWRQTGFASELIRTTIEGFLYDADSEVSSMVAVYSDDAGLDALFASCGFVVQAQEGGSLAHTTIADCLAVPLTGGRTSDHVVKLSQLYPSAIAALLSSNQIPQGLLEPDPALWAEHYLPCSYAYLTKGKIMGLILFVMRGNDLCLDYVYSKKPETMALPYLIESARKVLAATYPPETPVYLATTGAVSASIATKLLGKMETTSIHIAELDFDELLEEMSQYNN